jgi:putative tryptophan/tyrosine transport system substrate-binding protein
MVEATKLLRIARRQNMMRKLIVTIAFIFVGCTFLINHATAQNQSLQKVGIIWHLDAAEMALYQRSLSDAMRKLGWIEGRNIQYIVRYMEGDQARVPPIIKEFVAMKVDVIYLPDGAIAPAREVTRIIPMVAGDFYDPIAEGLTASLAKPSQNLTGISWQSIEGAGKRLELAKELVPGLRRVAFLYDATERGALIEQTGIVNGARIAKVELRNYPVQDPGSLRAAFEAIKSSRPDALIVSVTPLTWASREEIASFAATLRLPTIAEVAEFATVGFLLTYGANPLDAFTRGAYFLNKILRGAKPSELPIEQPTKFDFIVNLKTAKALGIKIPELIMLRATDVIR